MNPANQICVFGPIPSRRLGVSLGVDLTPFKTCPMDCVYCECGRTTSRTALRKEYFSTKMALSQIDAALAKRPDIDYITFSGTGEPTLHTGIGRIISYIKEKYPRVRVCLLTNSFFLSDPALRKELLGLDLIVPSLDGSNTEELEKMNRPEPFDFESLVRGIADFKKAFSGLMWLEIFIASGINDSMESAARFASLVERIAPDKVQLNTLDRPGTEHNVGIPDSGVLEKIRSIIARTGVPVECVGGRAGKKRSASGESVSECRARILATVGSRPCTMEDLSVTLGLPTDMVCLEVRQMEKDGLLVEESGPRGTYYRPA